MSAREKKKSKRVASLTDLLAEHTHAAEQEKQEIEERLRAKEEEDRQRQAAEELRQRELLRERLEEEKRRAEERFLRRDRQESPEAAAGTQSVNEGSGLIEGSTVFALQVPSSRKGHLLLAVLATVIVTGGGAAAAYFLLLADKSPQLDVMSRHAHAVLSETRSVAASLWDAHRATEEAFRRAAEAERLAKDIATLRAQVAGLETATQQAMSEADREVALRKAAEAARDGLPPPEEPTKNPRKPRKDRDEIPRPDRRIFEPGGPLTE